MNQIPSIAWLLLFLTGLTLCMALKPKVRRKWHWGRTANRVPMSGLGAFACVGALAILTIAAFGWLPFFTIFLPIPLLMGAALYDSWRDSRTK